MRLSETPTNRAAVHLREGIESFLRTAKGRAWEEASPRERLHALAAAVRTPALDAMRESERRYREQDAKRVYYLSMEFLMGRALGNNLTNLGLYDDAKNVLASLGADFEELEILEPDAALGNGGLGRLAACFLDSLATLDYPGFGYGINYEYGMFRQTFINGYQHEKPDHWMEGGTPWLIDRPDEAMVIPVYGSIDQSTDGGVYAPKWVDYKIIIGVPHDMPIVGYGGRTVNVLRLFSARASDEFDIGIFNSGDYIRAVHEKITGESISKVLYPSDVVAAGKELRLLQEYFLVACSVRDILKRYRRNRESYAEFPSKVAIQMNDTHPALTVAELMRVFIDEERMPWEEAWAMVVATCAYTNHTLLPEALEKWSYDLMARVLPRHLQIIQEINRRLLAEVEHRFPGDITMNSVAIVAHGEVRMANLAMAGSHSVNGVAAIHSRLVTETLAPGFHRLYPSRFNNKTNGVTPRRWLLHANRPLASLIRKTIGNDWITDLERLRELELFADDNAFLDKLAAVKRRNKAVLARVTKELTGITVDSQSLFDVQVKRVHEYKRQLLNALHVIERYWSIVEDEAIPAQPRTVFFAGKSAPGYFLAKLIIKLIHSVAEVVNADPRTRDHLRVVYLPDYRVTLAEAIMPAADLSEQISTAGKEASGTGNMKLALNGALTIGTLDGANIEIRDEVGDENIFIFGLKTDEVTRLLADGYDPQRYLSEHRWMRRAVDSIAAGHFSRGDKDIFRPIVARLLSTRDEYVHLADLPEYVERQREVDVAYLDPRSWLRKSLLNIARMGRFSSDRTIAEYAREIWNIEPAVFE